VAIVKNTKLVEIIEESTLIKGIFYYNGRIGEDNKLNRIIGQKHSYFTTIPTKLWIDFRSLQKVDYR
jgi:hypothetical protein